MDFHDVITIKGSTQEYEHVAEEDEAANIIINDLGIDKSLLKCKKPCEDYTTLQYKDGDLIRIKYTDKSKWIRVPMTTDMRKKYKDDPLFDAEKNKNKVMWKSNIENLHDYKNILLEVIKIRDDYNKD